MRYTENVNGLQNPDTMKGSDFYTHGGPTPKDGPSTANSPPRKVGKTTIGGVSGRFSSFSNGITMARGKKTPAQPACGYHVAGQ